MTPDELKRHFDRISEAPNAILHLRKFVLDLAVRGKLVEQDPADEPASQLVRRITLTKARKATELNLRQEKPLPLVAALDEPFSLPANWSWIRIGTCSLLIEYGTSVKSHSTEHGTPVLKMGDIQDGRIILGGQKKVPSNIDDLPNLLLKRFDLLYNRTNSAELVGKTGIYLGPDDAYTFASYLIRIRFINELTSSEYINHAMNAPYFRTTQIVPELQQQCGQANVNGSKLRQMLIPMPPLIEQKRIVSKINQLMTLCDELKIALAEQDRCRDSLVVAANHRLANEDDHEQFQAHARFCFNVLPLLTSRTEHIRQFRETILSLAVRGQLTSGDSTDVPATELMHLIQLEKNRVSEAGGLKKDKGFWDGLPTTPPYKIPDKWAWTRLQDIFEISRGGSPRPAGDPRYFGGSIPWITVGEITKDKGKYLTNTEGTLTEEGSTRSRFINPGDLLLTNSGATLGVPKISTIKACMNDGVAVLRLFHNVPLNDFAYLFLQSQTQRFRAINQGMGQPNLNTPIIAGWFFPLPPLAEQRRIVERVDLLMALCNELEIRLTSDAEVNRQLLEAILSKALGITEVSEGRGFSVDRKTNNLCPEEGKLHERTI